MDRKEAVKGYKRAFAARNPNYDSLYMKNYRDERKPSPCLKPIRDAQTLTGLDISSTTTRT